MRPASPHVLQRRPISARCAQARDSNCSLAGYPGLALSGPSSRGVRGMDHRIVGPGPYRATKLVSEHEGPWAMPPAPRFPRRPADCALLSLCFSGAGRPCFGGGTCLGRGSRLRTELKERITGPARSPGSPGSSFVTQASAVFCQFEEPVRPGDPLHPCFSLSYVIPHLLPGEEKRCSLL